MTWLEPAGDGRAQGPLGADGKTTTSPTITGDSRKGLGLNKFNAQNLQMTYLFIINLNSKFIYLIE